MVVYFFDIALIVYIIFCLFAVLTFYNLFNRKPLSLFGIAFSPSISEAAATMLLPKEKLHVVYLFMPLRPMKSRAANSNMNSNSLNSVIFAELELEFEI